ncbi:MAG TPA: hypothetical protein ENN63_08440 [Bacteroidetes bacterium]|nr:hypothetical protein [Bacteroidota bacterium]
MNRSGSTFLTQHLSRSENILVCLEAEVLVSEFLEAPGRKFCFTDRIGYLKHLWTTDYKLKEWAKANSNPDWEKLKAASDNLEAFCLLLAAYRDYVKPGATHVLFKAERLIYLFGKIARAAHTGMVFHPLVMIRDVRAIYESQIRTPMLPGNELMTKDPVKTSLDWNRFVRESSKLANRGSVWIIFFESFIRDQQIILHKLEERLGIDGSWEENGQGDVYERLCVEMKKIHRSIKGKADFQRIDQWKNLLKQEEIDVIESLSGRWLKQLGYKLTGWGKKNIRQKRTLTLKQMAYHLRRWNDKIIFHMGCSGK